MASKKSILYPLLKSKCPACHNGEFFTNKNPYRFKNLGDYHEHCQNCGQKFSLEPGFYFGAAYVSYALNVALFVTMILIVYLFVKETSIELYVLAVIIPTIILAPILFRYSRVIWAYMFIPYGGKEGMKKN